MKYATELDFNLGLPHNRVHVFGGIKVFISVTQQGQAGFMDAACRELPTKSLQEVEQHEQWYTEYCTLLESKRKAIQAWKNQKVSVIYALWL